MILNITLTLFLVFLNAFFVASEFALVRVRLSQLEMKIRAGSKLAKLSKSLIEKIDAYLSATQFGITIASLALGWIGESVVAEIVINIFNFLSIDISPELIHKISLPLAFVLITVMHIILGELVPKSLAIRNPETYAMAVSIPLKIFYIIFMPFIYILNFSANYIIKLFRINIIDKTHHVHTAEELRFLLEESTKSGIINTGDHKLLDNVFEFAETQVKQIMVPRRMISALDKNSNLNEIKRKFSIDGYSRIPIYENNIDNIIGFLYAKDFIKIYGDENNFKLEKLIHAPFFVPEDKKINILLKDMQIRHVHIAVVLDEFGGTAGIVSLEDIIEELVGEIQDEYDDETPIYTKISENIYNIKASASIADINDILPIPLDESEDYETVAGFILNELERIPDKNEIIKTKNYIIKILKLSKRTIDTIQMKIISDEGGE